MVAEEEIGRYQLTVPFPSYFPKSVTPPPVEVPVRIIVTMSRVAGLKSAQSD